MLLTVYYIVLYIAAVAANVFVPMNTGTPDIFTDSVPFDTTTSLPQTNGEIVVYSANYAIVLPKPVYESFIYTLVNVTFPVPTAQFYLLANGPFNAAGVI